MDPTPQKSILIPVLLSVLITAVIAGGTGYFIGIGPDPTPTPTPITTKKASLSSTTSSSPSPSASPITADTSTWKTYQSARLKLSFKYPADFMLDNKYENSYPDQSIINLYTQAGYALINSKAGVEGPDVIELSAYNNPEHLSALEWARIHTSHSNFTGQYKEDIINGEKALAYNFSGEGDGTVRLLVHGDLAYVLTALLNSSTDSRKVEVAFQQILPTITFAK